VALSPGNLFFRFSTKALGGEGRGKRVARAEGKKENCGDPFDLCKSLEGEKRASQKKGTGAEKKSTAKVTRRQKEFRVNRRRRRGKRSQF